MATVALGLSVVSDDPIEEDRLARFRLIYGLGDKEGAYKVLFDSYTATDAHDVFRELVKAKADQLQTRTSLEGVKEDCKEIEEILLGWLGHVSADVGNNPYEVSRYWRYMPSIQQVLAGGHLYETGPKNAMVWRHGDKSPSTVADVPVFADLATIFRQYSVSQERDWPWSIDWDRALIRKRPELHAAREQFEILPIEQFLALS
jgi:hypothetical protein